MCLLSLRIDHLGNLLLTLNQAGTSVLRQDYTPLGEVCYQIGTTSTTILDFAELRILIISERAILPMELYKRLAITLAWILASMLGGLLASELAVTYREPGRYFIGVALAVPQWLVLQTLIRHAAWWIVLTEVGVVIGWLGAALLGWAAFLLLFLLQMLVVVIGSLLNALGVTQLGAFDWALTPDSLHAPWLEALAGGLWGLALGIILGSLQFTVLQPDGCARHGWLEGSFGPQAQAWLIASAVGGIILSSLLYSSALPELPPQLPIMLPLPWLTIMIGPTLGAVLGAGYGLITGPALARLLRPVT